MHHLHKIMLSLTGLLLCGTTAVADYDPTNPPEPTVKYELTTKCIPAGSGRDMSGAGSYTFGTSVRMNVGANTGFRFVQWENEEGDTVSTTARFDYIMPASDMTLIARFVYVPSDPTEPDSPEIKEYSTIYLKAVPADGGSFNQSPGHSYEVGSTQVFRATANPNYRFVNWTEDGVVISESSSLSYTVPSDDRTLVANFAYEPGSPTEPGPAGFSHKLTLVSNPSDAATLSGGGYYNEGETRKITANVNQHYYFISWTAENGDTISETKDFEFTMPNHDVTLTANFSRWYNPLNPAEPGNEGASVETMVQKPRFAMYDDFHVMILCGTQGSTIHYTIDGSEPSRNLTEKCKLYTEPFFVPTNLLVKAIAFKDGLENSPVVSYQVTAYTVADPEISFANRKVAIFTATEGATIRYTLDMSDPNESSPIYTAPFEPEKDCQIRAYASKEDYIDSQSVDFFYRKEDYTLPVPAINNDYRNSCITIEAEEWDMAVTIDETTTEYVSPVTIEVNPGMKTVRAMAFDKMQNFFDSDSVVQQLIFHLPPSVSYDGHEITAVRDDNDPELNAAELNIKFNGDSIAENYMVRDFGDYEAYVESDVIFRSPSVVKTIDFFNDGSKAGARNGHRISEGFDQWEKKDGYPELTLVGEISREDLEFVSDFGELTTLHIETDMTDDSSYENVFSKSRIATVSLTSAPDGLLGNMPRLTTVVWRDSLSAMPVKALGENFNPNLLLWVKNKDVATENVSNIVTYTEIATDRVITIEAHADSIMLTPGFPYNAHAPVDVDYIKFCKDFSQLTDIGVCRGWETIVLPFAPDSIYHKTRGEIWPYAKWVEAFGRGDFGDEGPKPFWMYEATSENWIPADSIRAGVPYIISMPNSKDYFKAFNLKGESVFVAKSVKLGTEEPDAFPYVSSWIDDMSLHATFMPVEEEHLSLNNEWEDAIGDILPGSTFTENAETLPFEAYLTGYGAMRSMPLFGGGSGIILPIIDDYGGISINAIGNGMIRVSSSLSCDLNIFTSTGIPVRNIKLNQGECVVVEDLSPGIYLVAGKKIMVK